MSLPWGETISGRKRRKVHRRAGKRPACGIDRRWSSCVITTTPDPSRVTCRRRGCVPQDGG